MEDMSSGSTLSDIKYITSTFLPIPSSLASSLLRGRQPYLITHLSGHPRNPRFYGDTEMLAQDTDHVKRNGAVTLQSRMLVVFRLDLSLSC